MKYIAKLSPSFQAKIMQNIVKAWSKIVQIVIVSSKTSYVLDIQLYRSLEEIASHRKKLRATGRNFLSQEQISCDRNKFAVTGTNFLFQEET